MSDKFLSRRNFLSLAGLAGAGLAVGAACSRTPAATPTPTVMAGMDSGAPAQSGPTADEMDAMHKTGVETFVANAGKDTTFWRQPLQPKMDGDVKVFEVTCTEGKWNPACSRSKPSGQTWCWWKASATTGAAWKW